MVNIIARVISQEGTCEAGHKVGDEFNLGQGVPSGMCPWACNALFAPTTVLKFGGSFPWEKDPDKARVACPDPDNPVIFELRRVEEI